MEAGQGNIPPQMPWPVLSAGQPWRCSRWLTHPI